MTKYLVVYEKTKAGYSAYVPDIAGMIVNGKTKKIVEKNIFKAIRFHVEGLKEENIRIAKPQAESEVMVFG